MSRTRSLTPKMITDFCRLRLKGAMDEQEVVAVSTYLVGLLELQAFPPYRGKWIDWSDVSVTAGVDETRLRASRYQLQPIFDALSRNVALEDVAEPVGPPKVQPKTSPSKSTVEPKRSRRGPAPKPIVEHPEPFTTEFDDLPGFGEALNMHMRRHGDTVRHLYLALNSKGEAQDQRTLMKWCTGQLLPMTARSFVVLNNIERRYRLPLGYFKSKLPHQARAIRGVTLSGLPAAERRRLAWHLPDDFLTRPKAEQEEILEWVRRVIISGSTDYRQFQAAAMRQRYAVRFTAFQNAPRRPATKPEDEVSDLDAEVESALVDAPAALEAEMNALLRFKTATLTALGFQRNGVWND